MKIAALLKELSSSDDLLYIMFSANTAADFLERTHALPSIHSIQAEMLQSSADAEQLRRDLERVLLSEQPPTEGETLNPILAWVLPALVAVSHLRTPDFDSIISRFSKVRSARLLPAQELATHLLKVRPEVVPSTAALSGKPTCLEVEVGGSQQEEASVVRRLGGVSKQESYGKGHVTYGTSNTPLELCVV